MSALPPGPDGSPDLVIVALLAASGVLAVLSCLLSLTIGQTP